ncbi:MAG: rhombosortase [Cognaticolwellia sp.]
MLQLKPLPFQITHSVGPLVVAVIALFGFIFDADIADAVIYHRELIDAGEYWRLISGHFLHSNGNHFMLNIAAVALLWALHGHYYSYQNYLGIFVTCALVCSIAMFWFSQDIALYVGLSGVLHGFFVWGALMDIRQHEKTGYLLFIGVILKIGHEQIYGASADVEALIGASVATDAHLYGAIGGLLTFGISYAWDKKNTRFKLNV